MKPYKIHFVCRGNTYRSRLAEACLKSLRHPHISVSSSGIEADHTNPGIETSPYTIHAATRAGIKAHLASHKTQTTSQLLDDADIIVFMSHGVHRDAAKKYAINPYKTAVWNVDDMEPALQKGGFSPSNSEHKQLVADITYQRIEQKVRSLLRDLTRVSWANVIDDQNRKAGFRLPITWIDKQNLWRRGCHAVITTADRKFLVEKRSSTIVYFPGKLDVTMGGGIDDGESPHEAMIREVREELGLQVSAKDLKPLRIEKSSHYHPHYRRHTRCFAYVFHITLAERKPIIKPQLSEVSDVAIMSKRKLKTLLTLHRIAGLGSLKSGFAFYSSVVRQVLADL